MTPAAFLRRAWALIDDRDRWCQVDYAVDAAGRPMYDSASPRVARRCAQAAVDAAHDMLEVELPAGPHGERDLEGLCRVAQARLAAIAHLNAVAADADVPTYYHLNDDPGTSWEDVRDMWAEAIRRAESAGAA